MPMYGGPDLFAKPCIKAWLERCVAREEGRRDNIQGEVRPALLSMVSHEVIQDFSLFSLGKGGGGVQREVVAT